MSEPIVAIDSIKRHAERAAEMDAGPQANPYPDDSIAHVEWRQHYYRRVQQLAEECAQ